VNAPELLVASALGAPDGLIITPFSERSASHAATVSRKGAP
jgi:hypothetical protein